MSFDYLEQQNLKLRFVKNPKRDQIAMSASFYSQSNLHVLPWSKTESGFSHNSLVLGVQICQKSPPSIAHFSLFSPDENHNQCSRRTIRGDSLIFFATPFEPKGGSAFCQSANEV